MEPHLKLILFIALAAITADYLVLVPALLSRADTPSLILGVAMGIAPLFILINIVKGVSE